LKPDSRERLQKQAVRSLKAKTTTTTMRLFVGNLSFQTTEDDLRDTFAQHGTITDVKIMTDRMTGRSRGFGFVTLSTREEGEAAIRSLDNQPLGGRPLRVNEATPREEGGGSRAPQGRRQYAGNRY
jgi:cold-inducible RNA-binding protein